MKITASVAILALVASQAMAVVPEPVPECTKSVIVRPTDKDGCVAFATRWNTTFENLLKWNAKLRKDCLNLDEGHPICVSITPGAGTLEPRPSSTPVVPPTTPTTSGGVVPPVKPTSSGATVPTGGVPPPVVAPGASSSAGGAAPTPVKPVVNNPDSANKASGAEGTKASMFLAAAGVLLSVAYML
ncbi:hypothetical protein BGZ93_002597 [Podila epicladia]|nr:hypothetical protein BGZ92_000501 [Podila epicladia]KAG0097493.1 hypothetical protein BGZ93_002597 [Podila epicladia]